MDVPGWVWGLTIVGIVGLLAFDFVFHVRKAHVPTLREAAVWSAVYVGIAVLFGVGVLVFGGPEAGSEYFAGNRELSPGSGISPTGRSGNGEVDVGRFDGGWVQAVAITATAITAPAIR